MHQLGQGDDSSDGWGKANELRDALNIDSDVYTDWAKR